MNNCKIIVDSIDIVETTCFGHFCDKQRSAELIKNGKPCGCYQMRGMHSKLSILHRIKMSNFDNTIADVVMDDFSSLKFSLLYMTEYFPHTTKRIIFDGTDELDELYECIDKVLSFYNGNGGFTVIGWYKRGEINDTSISEEKQPEKISSSILGYHFVSIYPTHYIAEHAYETEEMKFNVLNISKA